MESDFELRQHVSTSNTNESKIEERVKSLKLSWSAKVIIIMILIAVAIGGLSSNPLKLFARLFM